MTAAETQILLNELQSKVDQLPTKGTLKALEYRLDAILQANLDTFWLLICAILVFLMQAGFMCLESGLSRNKNSINVALKNVTDFGIAVVIFWAFGSYIIYILFFHYKSCWLSNLLCFPGDVRCNSSNYYIRSCC